MTGTYDVLRELEEALHTVSKHALTASEALREIDRICGIEGDSPNDYAPRIDTERQIGFEALQKLARLRAAAPAADERPLSALGRDQLEREIRQWRKAFENAKE